MDGEKRKRGGRLCRRRIVAAPTSRFGHPAAADTSYRSGSLSGRAISEEVVPRLEQSFMERDILTRVFGGEDVILFAQLVAGEVQVTQALTNRVWREARATANSSRAW